MIHLWLNSCLGNRKRADDIPEYLLGLNTSLCRSGALYGIRQAGSCSCFSLHLVLWSMAMHPQLPEQCGSNSIFPVTAHSERFALLLHTRPLTKQRPVKSRSTQWLAFSFVSDWSGSDARSQSLALSCVIITRLCTVFNQNIYFFIVATYIDSSCVFNGYCGT